MKNGDEVKERKERGETRKEVLQLCGSGLIWPTRLVTQLH
jgi:hypothetical protein